jgi:ABC-type branched-subunit amino acid transport system substrate-binding protein
MLGTAPPCARLIRLAREHGLKTTFIAVSFIGAEALLSRLGDELAEGVVISQVVPHPELSQLPAAVSFRAAVPDANKRSFVSFEGYMAARSFLRALQDAPAGADAEALIDHIEEGHPWDLGLGQEHTLSGREHQISHTLWHTVIQGGQILPLKSWKDLNKEEQQHAKR